MKNKTNIILFGIIIASILFLSSCAQLPLTQKACTQEAKICPDGSAVGRTGSNCDFANCPDVKVGMANPASVYCEQNGGAVNIVTEKDGSQRGDCILADGQGTVCDEWAYFRGECGNNSAVKKECSGSCPQFMPPAPGWCSDGTIVASKVDACGCRGPPSCVMPGDEVICTADAKLCPDGSSVSRAGPNCEFEQCPCTCPTGYLHDEANSAVCNPQCYYNTPKCLAPSIQCTQTEPVSDAAPAPVKQSLSTQCPLVRQQACTREYNPVCGYFDESIKCFKYPCAATYGNKCNACADEKVAYYEEGECPK